MPRFVAILATKESSASSKELKLPQRRTIIAPHLRGGLMSNIDQVLHPKKEDILQAEMSSGQGIEELQRGAQFDVRRVMNGIKTVGAALRLSINSPEASSDKFGFLLSEAARISRILMLKWGQNPEDRQNFWMLNVIEKNIMPYLGNEPLAEEMIDKMASNLLLASSDFPDNNAWKNSAVVDLALFKGLSKISLAQEEYSFFRKDKEKDLLDVRDHVIQQAVSVLEEIAPTLASHEDRVVLMAMIFDELFDIMLVSWNRSAAKAKQAFSGFTAQQIKTWKNANPSGFPLTPVFDYFDQNAGRLVRLTMSARKKGK